ncbi:MarR family winged helix-turn-helix transcriptional regulator [Gordonia neofelifaecis]|uniref:MarR family transcriptional regulator n=1 Tax=Gordonia neofelifaecis NRRL B-59395 TaxID=644548 RepID=F1YGW0_9ACTN|nr:MarR family transcriptional regulator [Gordonia neofelifaecis]EGD56258.1 MarR family transcriptional regulator [Gordonia neofelifaecis NRRL B-59395]
MGSPRWLSSDEQKAWRAYLDGTRLLLTALDQQLVRDAGLSFTDFELLVALSEAPGLRLRMSSLADAVTTTRSSVTRATTRLVEAGWVERIPCMDDRRGAWAHLTPAGVVKLEQTAPAHVDEVRNDLIDLLDPAELAAIESAFKKVRERLV